MKTATKWIEDWVRTITAPARSDDTDSALETHKKCVDKLHVQLTELSRELRAREETENGTEKGDLPKKQKEGAK